MGKLQYTLQKKPLIDIYLVASRHMSVALYQWLFINRYQWQLFRLLAILDEAKCLDELQMMMTSWNVALMHPLYLYMHSPLSYGRKKTNQKEEST